MKVLVEVRHPAHVHHFRFMISELTKRGHNVHVLATEKEIVEELLLDLGIEYEVIGFNRIGFLRKAIEVLRQAMRVFKIMSKYKPNLVVGRPSAPLLFTAWVRRVPRLVFAEDDVRAVLINAIFSLPFASRVISPRSTDLMMFESKKIPYSGFQKLAYLQKPWFSPDQSVIAKYGLGKPYCIIRLSSLQASHDLSARGISEETLQRLIVNLKGRFRVYITSERPLPSEYENLRLRVNVSDMHSILAFSSLLVCDSQSMAAEAALLGVPNIRFSSFVGKLGYLEELEEAGLSVGVLSDDPDRLLSELDALLNQYDEKLKSMRSNLDILLSVKINVTSFMIWLVENHSRVISGEGQEAIDAGEVESVFISQIN